VGNEVYIVLFKESNHGHTKHTTNSKTNHAQQLNELKRELSTPLPTPILYLPPTSPTFPSLLLPAESLTAVGVCNYMSALGSKKRCTWYAWSGCDMSRQDGSEEGMVDVLRTTELWEREPEDDNRLEEVIER
jgi:hypothetical protein